MANCPAIILEPSFSRCLIVAPTIYIHIYKYEHKTPLYGVRYELPLSFRAGVLIPLAWLMLPMMFVRDTLLPD